jgi:hypothetical protein
MVTYFELNGIKRLLNTYKGETGGIHERERA